MSLLTHLSLALEEYFGDSNPSDTDTESFLQGFVGYPRHISITNKYYRAGQEYILQYYMNEEGE